MACNSASPWGERFRNCKVVEQVVIRVPDAEELGEVITLSPLDHTPAYFSLAISGVLLLPRKVPRDTLVQAAGTLAAKYPLIAGRFQSGGKFFQVECSNAGFPLTFAKWPEGSLDQFPAAMTFKGWQTELPARLAMPFFVDELDGFKAVLDQQPLFKLRLTMLGGDDACILAITASHALCDGIHIAAVSKDLAKACRGEPLVPLPNGLSRDLLTAQGLADAVPFLKPVLDSVSAQIAAEGEEDIEPSFMPAWEATFGSGPESVPTWPVVDTCNDYAAAVLNIPRTDLVGLKAKLASATGQSLSTNDVLVGLHWTMRAVLAGKPLPGKEVSQNQIGFTSINIAANSFPGILDHCFGCTGTAFLVTLPPPGNKEETANGGAGAVADKQTALVNAVANVAAANRQALQKWRSGGDIVGFLKGLMAPNRLRSFKAAIDRARAAGLQVMSMLSNMSFLGEADAAQMDFGSGAPTDLYILFDRATRMSLAVPSKGFKSVLLQAFVPTNAEELLAGAGFFQTLIPNARFA